MKFLKQIRTILLFILSFSFFLRLKAQEPKLMLPIGHTDYIKGARISPDGKRVVTMGSDSRVILWDLQRGLRLATLDTKNTSIDDVAFNPGGTRILGLQVYGDKNRIPLWNNLTGELVALLQHSMKIKHAEFSPDGKAVLTASWDGRAKTWDATTGKELLSLPASEIMGTNARFSFTGKKILTSGREKAVIWDAITGGSILEIKGHSEIIQDAAFSPDEKKIVTISNDKTAKIWDAESGTLLFTLALSDKGETAFFNVAGDAIITKASSIGQQDIKLWNAQTGKLLQTLYKEKDYARFTVFSRDGKLVALGSEEYEVKVWNTATGKLVYTLAHNGAARDAVFTRDDSQLIVVTGAREARVWDMRSGTLLNDIKTKDYAFTDVELSVDWKTMVLPSGNNAQVWDFQKMSLLTELKGHSKAVEAINFSAGKDMVITNNRANNFTRLWDAEKADLLSPEIYSTIDGAAYSSVYSPSYNKFMRKLKDYKTVEIWVTRKGTLQTLLDKRYSSGLIRWVFTGDDKKLITGGIDTAVRIWDTENGKLLNVLAWNKTSTIDEVLLSPDDKKILVTDSDNNGVIWDMGTGRQLARMNKMHPKTMEIPVFVENKNWLLTSSKDGLLKIWNTDNGELVANLAGNKSSLSFYSFSPDHQRMVTAAWYDDAVRLWDLSNKKLIATLRGHKGNIWSVKMTPDWKYIVTQSMLEPTIRVWDSETGDLLQAFPAHELRPLEVLFSADSKFMYSRGNDNVARKWELPTGKLLHTFEGHQNKLTSIAYDEDSKELLTGSTDGEAKLWNTATGELLHTYTGHNERINAARFAVKKNTIITSADDHTVKTWNKETAKIINTFFAVDEKEYHNQVAGGYYKSSTGAAKLLHYITGDLKPITFEQLDVKYNRPDKVLEAIGSADTALIRSYRKAYEKRIKKLGIDTTAFREGYSVPGADFANRDVIEHEQRNEKLNLHIKGYDSIFRLDRFNIWVNEIPVYGQRGIGIRSKNSHEVDTTVAIKLSQGENRIEASVTNVNGTESYRMQLLINYTPAVRQKEMVRFIGIGIDQFADNQYNLKYSAKDIRDLSAKLKEKYGNDIIIDTLFNENVTISKVKALKQKLLQTTVNDKVIISYSGHGMLSKGFDYYLSTYAVNFDKPEENGLAYDELENLLDSIPARKKIMLIDACHSGEVDKEDLMAMNGLDTSKIKRGLKPVAYKNGGHLGLKNSFELMQSLFVNVGKSTGAVIISAAAGTQFALESNNLKNGVFTYCILDAMNTYPSMKISELKKIVGERVEQLTNGLQKPTSRNETIAVDWEVW